MNGLLKTGDRVVLTIEGELQTRARVRETYHDGCLLVTYGGKEILARGTQIDVQSSGDGPKKTYYMQVKTEPLSNHPYLLLQRNPGAEFNQRRRGWRIPFTVPTKLRICSEHHVRSASFCDLSLTSARVASECPIRPETDVELFLVLPKYGEHMIEGKVVRSSTAPVSKDAFGQDLYGLVIVFESMSTLACKQLTFFLWYQVRQAYPRQMRLLYDTAHHKKERARAANQRQGARSPQG